MSDYHLKDLIDYMDKKYIYWKGWILIIIVIISLLLLLNFLLPLKSFFPVVGDEKDWLTIWVSLISSIIATIVGFMLQRNYSIGEYEKEQKLVALRTKVDKSKILYNEMKNIVQSNISIFNFNEFRKLIQYIDCKTTNAELIAKIYDYQSSVISSHERVESFFQNKERSVECIVYKEIVGELTRIYKRILPEFIDYLNSVDKNFHKNMTNADNLLPFVEKKDQLKLSMLKVRGNNMIYEYKEKLINVLDCQKANMDQLTEALRKASTNLLNDEEKKIKKLELECEIGD